jgi:16S rRNA processing protein RimM
MKMIKIGQVVNAVGLRGELKIYPYCQNKERFETLDSIMVDEAPVIVERVRYKANLVILKIHGVDNRTDAEALKGKDVWMKEEDLEHLPDGTYYIKDILGFAVEDKNRGIVGTLKDVKNNGAQDLFVIEKIHGGEFLVPVVEQFFHGANLQRQTIFVDLIEGMYED